VISPMSLNSWKPCAERFTRACATLQLTDNTDPFTEIVVAKIVEQARTGENDPERLYIEALDELKRRAS
jgi:hypothetical protein